MSCLTRCVRLILFGVTSLLLLGVNARAEELPADYQEALKVLGRAGDYKDGVLKVNIPRNDLHVSVAGVATPTPFGFGGWVAFAKGDAGMEVMMGDLVLLAEEVNPVLTVLLDKELEATALHNHFFWEEPRLFYLHIHGHGKAADLAAKVKPALDLIGHVAPASTPVASPAPRPATPVGKLDTARITKLAGHEGEQSGLVYKITVGRDDLKVREMGATINARMGLNSWATFLGTDESAAVAGDVAMLESEVTPVLQALRKNGLDVVAIHHHMLGTRPVIIFLHYWGHGPAAKLAMGFRAALDQLGNK